jgi:hypothetical protein
MGIPEDSAANRSALGAREGICVDGAEKTDEGEEKTEVRDWEACSRAGEGSRSSARP